MTGRRLHPSEPSYKTHLESVSEALDRATRERDELRALWAGYPAMSDDDVLATARMTVQKLGFQDQTAT
jgi:hypothetical protein